MTLRHREVEFPTNTLTVQRQGVMVYTEDVKFTIMIPEKVSLNRIYAGVHFRERSAHKAAYQMAVLAANLQPWSGAYPVDMHYHFKLPGNRLDISNHSYMVKMVEDGLVACGVLSGDEQKYVARVSCTAEQVPSGSDPVVDVSIEEIAIAKPRTSRI